MRRMAIVAVMTAMCVSTGLAAFSKNDAGTAGAPFLKLGAGARAAGMGEAFTAVTDSADSIYWNPAGLASVEGKSLSVMHGIWFEGISYDWAAYAQKIKGVGTVGIGVQYLSYGSIGRTDSSGLDSGSFSPSDLAVSLSYARSVKGLDLGANVKYISSKITKTATAFAADLGARRRFCDRLVLGAAVQNMGTGLKFVDKEDPLPFAVKVGGAYDIRANWKVALDANAPIDNDVYYALGTEYGCRVSKAMEVAGRLGYNTRANDTGGLNSLSAGLGLRYMDYSLDYAFVPYGELGNTSRISFGLKF